MRNAFAAQAAPTGHNHICEIYQQQAEASSD